MRMRGGCIVPLILNKWPGSINNMHHRDQDNLVPVPGCLMAETKDRWSVIIHNIRPQTSLPMLWPRSSILLFVCLLITYFDQNDVELVFCVGWMWLSWTSCFCHYLCLVDITPVMIHYQFSLEISNSECWVNSLRSTVWRMRKQKDILIPTDIAGEN